MKKYKANLAVMIRLAGFGSVEYSYTRVIIRGRYRTMSELDRRYDAALDTLKHKIEAESLKGVEALRAFVEITHKDSPTGLPHFWWCGVYMLGKKNSSRELQLEASSSPACSPLPVEPRTGGVCSDCALTEKPIIVNDVASYPGHVACDPRSRSEVVVPVFSRDGSMIAILDVDDIVSDSFSREDVAWLVKFAELLSKKL